MSVGVGVGVDVSVDVRSVGSRRVYNGNINNKR